MTDTTSTKATEPASEGFSLIAFFRSPAAGAFMGFVVVFVIFAIFGFSRNFLSVPGITTWVNFASLVGIIAIPVGFLMIAGELDISTGAVLPAGAMTVAIVSGHYELPVLVGILVALGIGALIGFVNGTIVTRTQVPSFIVTLATLFAVAGLTLYLSILFINNTNSFYQAPAWAKSLFGGKVFGFNSSVFWWAGLVAVFYYFLHKSPKGPWVFALGGDQESARNAGIPVRNLKIGLFMLCSTCAAFAGALQVITFNSATSQANFGLIFNTIISVVVGGVLLTGGFGTVMGIVFGVLTLAIVTQAIGFTEIDRNLSFLIIGVMLLIAVLMNDTFRNLATSWSTSKKK
ncbi:Inner membrane ABC transporter permease protein YjfF [Marinovum algicola]|uniref:Xylose transport system permease protein XylH n=1 Tax=Marinovum algicola TaxID=42444 RepID=A0A975WF18_9RHOB|nr:ABC transporter permease [Marinovum algicola]SEK09563.1 monosaccharide ABC transporter membrane protein, CUT2 family [Marinovum algicola]SLN76768.1 Inner membrane ABC transporter permease protein YjfF [Marinovum algicola]